MAISRKLIAHDDNCNQWLKVDHSSRYIQNESNWQFLFDVDSLLDNSSQVVRIGVKFDEDSFNNLKITAYLYDQKNDSVANASSCSVKISKVILPDWTEEELVTVNAAALSNLYFYANPLLSAIDAELDGSTTLLIKVSIVRLGITYNERVYINHLGVYDTTTRLNNKINFLQLTKADE